jgi:hypothetical protein
MKELTSKGGYAYKAFIHLKKSMDVLFGDSSYKDGTGPIPHGKQRGTRA